MHKIRIVLITLGVLLVLSFLFVWQVRDLIYQVSYDLFNENKIVESPKRADAILKSFKILSLADLPTNYLELSNINNRNYSKMYKGSKFYVISPLDIYQRIVGETRIKDLLSRDDFYSKAIMNRSKVIYWRIDKRIIYKIFELRKELRKKKYDENGFRISDGFRTPTHNKKVGGASKSVHIKGEAIDMVIKDIDKNGIYSDEDKQIVIDILETKIIKNAGGIGKYPGTRIVHIDIRGYRARWDSY